MVPNEPKQRSDYTYKFNVAQDRHGWLRLTPAFSVKVVDGILASYGSGAKVLDPFGGTGTTALSAARRGHQVTTVDINPFLVWLAQIKTGIYGVQLRAKLETVADEISALVGSMAVEPADPPPMHRIDKWWSPSVLRQLCYLKAALMKVSEGDESLRDLLNIAFCRSVIKSSSVRFNHQSLSLQGQLQFQLDCRIVDGFLDDVRTVGNSLSNNPLCVAQVSLGDSKSLDSSRFGHHDIVITSPPYVNRMSYIRELRPYMYWLGYLTNGREAAELDWQTIGGTWGIATSRLADWRSDERWWLPDKVHRIISRIIDAPAANSRLMANYVLKYFIDISEHFYHLRGVLNRGSKLHYIVGNSSFYGILVPTQEIYAAILEYYNFTSVSVSLIRKRNSKRELFEFEITAEMD